MGFTRIKCVKTSRLIDYIGSIRIGNTVDPLVLDFNFATNLFQCKELELCST
jgi:hypothetical protein